MTETTDAAGGRPPLHRSATDRYIAGVCAGIARSLGLDPTLVRVAAVILAALGGAGILAYGAAVLLMPEEGRTEPLRRGTGGDRRDALVGIVLLALGFVAVFGVGPWHRTEPADWLGWTLLIALLVAVSTPALRARWLHRPAQPAGEAEAETTQRAGSTYEAPTTPIPPAPAPRRTPAGDVAAIAGGVALVAVAVAGALAATGAIDLRWDVLLAASVVLVGAALTVGALYGGARPLVAPAILLIAVTGVVSAADLDLRGGIGDRIQRPATLADVPGAYRLAIGRLDVDLSRLAVPAGVTRRVTVRLGVGQARVTVPRGVAVTVDGHANAGVVAALGQQANGTDVDLDAASRPVAATRRLVIDVRVGLGEVLVRRDGDAVTVRGRYDWNPPAPFAVVGWQPLGRVAGALV